MDYAAAFQDAFPIPENAATVQHIRQALACFERTLGAGAAPFDRYFFAGKMAMSDAAVRRSISSPTWPD
jgi:cytochrome c peroxidase